MIRKIKLGIIAMMLTIATTHGQSTFNFKPTGSPGDNTLTVTNLQADLEIVGYSGNEIKVEALDYDGELPERAKGLKPLSQVGEDNTSIGLFVKQEGSNITLAGTNKRADDAHYKVSIPSNMGLKVEYTGWQSGDLKIGGVSGELEVKSNVADIILKDVTGPVVLSTLSSDIEVVFKNVSQVGPTSISSTSGDIDITLPSGAKGNFKLSSISGEIYTNIEFEMEGEEKEGLRRWSGGTSAKATLNGGGVEFKVNAISGDVFIRKSY